MGRMLHLLWIVVLFGCSATAQALETDLISLICTERPSFELKTTENERALVQDSKFSLTYNPQDVLIQFSPDANFFNMFINSSAIDFRGNVITGHLEPESTLHNVYWTSIGSISVTGTVFPEGDRDDYKVANCRLFLSPKSTDGGNLFGAEGVKVRRYAEFCLAPQVCEHFASARNGNIQPMAVQSPPPLSQYDNFSGFHININKLIDTALRELREKLIKNGETTIDVPEIHETFQTGSGIFQTNGRFDTTKGLFKNLATIHRTADAKLSKEDEKYSAAAGFGLTIANLNFDQYRLKFGIISVSGRLEANTNGIALAAKMTVDYSTPQCTKSLDYIKVTNLGHINIRITGLGKLNSLLSKLVTWISKNWKGYIVDKIETNLNKAARKQLAKFNCEDYRPNRLPN